MRQEDSLRYSRYSDIIQIVIKMQSTSEGLTLNDIADELCATRRTAERVKNLILRNFPQIDELPSPDRFKRWGFINQTGYREFASGLIGFRENELFELEKIKKQFKEDTERTTILKGIIDKLKALMRDTRNSQETLNSTTLKHCWSLKATP